MTKGGTISTRLSRHVEEALIREARAERRSKCQLVAIMIEEGLIQRGVDISERPAVESPAAAQTE